MPVFGGVPLPHQGNQARKMKTFYDELGCPVKEVSI